VPEVISSVVASSSSADVQIYRQHVDASMQTMMASLGRFFDLTDERDIGLNDRQLQVVLELRIWRRTNAMVQELTPPPGYDAFHTAFIEAMTIYLRAATDMETGIQSGVIGLVDSAIQKIDAASRLMSAAKVIWPSE